MCFRPEDGTCEFSCSVEADKNALIIIPYYHTVRAIVEFYTWFGVALPYRMDHICDVVFQFFRCIKADILKREFIWLFCWINWLAVQMPAIDRVVNRVVNDLVKGSVIALWEAFVNRR
ncbi:hypothetical protein [Entomobacter blattae]|uniref:hypothetical protein n=1 Tax=Entomobacter blattae TaxID=2762277 RepID=UPI00193C2E01|nr:hypothetical protein [Entomobacter blattae]